jgi:hypothetical protein
MIPLFIGALMLYKAANGQVAQQQTTLAPASQTVEEYVRQYYSDEPVLAEIARCESRFRQYDENGVVLRGEAVPADIGIMQINERFHQTTSETLGYDIKTIEGNLSYARYLYEKEGTRPWKSSQKCWNKAKSDVKVASVK